MNSNTLIVLKKKKKTYFVGINYWTEQNIILLLSTSPTCKEEKDSMGGKTNV